MEEFIQSAFYNISRYTLVAFLLGVVLEILLEEDNLAKYFGFFGLVLAIYSPLRVLLFSN
tara:strand:+ start:108 stop:287 length:180 start_codon:yes stop_codon:yes gene_type:complete